LLQPGLTVTTLAVFTWEDALRFELIDRVLETQEDSLTGVKVVSAAEEYLADHFPGFPVLPGVMMLEALVQAGRLFIAGRPEASDRPMVVTEVRNVRYGNMVRPGEALTVKVALRKHEGAGYEFQGTGTVGQQTAVRGRFRLEPLNAV
jgi:3-hydroxyacyl-[acyl-carrier-protein] dehydratase